MRLSEKITKARKEAGKSQESVAREICISLRTYQQYERGTVKPKRRRVLEKALNVPIGYFDEPEMSYIEQADFIKASMQTLLSDDRFIGEKDNFIKEIKTIIRATKGDNIRQ